MSTLHVNFYGGPGTGKSTTRALTFGALKQRGHNVEEVPEFAKDLTWEQRFGALDFQPYIFGKQTYKAHRLEGQVQAILSDTSPLLSIIYAPTPEPVWWNSFTNFILDYYRSLNTLNVFLRRDPSRPYNPKGRSQTEDEAKAYDVLIEDLLGVNNVPYVDMTVDRTSNRHVKAILELIEDRMLVCDFVPDPTKWDKAAVTTDEDVQRDTWSAERLKLERERLRHDAEYGLK